MAAILIGRTENGDRVTAIVRLYSAKPGGRREQEVHGLEASFTYEQATRRGRVWSCGAGLPEALKQVTTYAPGWNAERSQQLAALAERWHLNGMRAGCEHQRAAGWTYTEHPSEPCPVCGYRFGTAWLFEELPADVEATICALGVEPETGLN